MVTSLSSSTPKYVPEKGSHNCSAVRNCQKSLWSSLPTWKKYVKSVKRPRRTGASMSALETTDSRLVGVTVGMEGLGTILTAAAAAAIVVTMAPKRADLVAVGLC